MTQAQYGAEATQIANTAGVPAGLFASLINVESGWDATSYSSKGAIGLTQLMPGTAMDLGVNPWDTQSNLYGGAAYLSQMFRKFGNWRDALAAYNAGPGNIQAGYGYADTVLAGAGMSGTSASAAPVGVNTIPDSALPSTGNPITDWLRGQFQQMFGGAYVNVPAGTPVGTPVTGPGAPPGATVGTPDQAAPGNPYETMIALLNGAKDWLISTFGPLLGIIAIISVALLFAYFGIKSFFPGKTAGVTNNA